MRRLAVWLILTALAPGVARAAACPESWVAGAGPLPGGTGPADFGAIPEACAASDLGLRVRGTLLVASAAPDFYGNVGGAATLRVRHRLGARTWMSLALDLATYRYVVNAVIPSSGVGFGPPTVGVYQGLIGGPDLALAIYGRVLLPLDSARQNGIETGVEVGLAARRALHPRFGLEGGVALTAPIDVVAGQTHARLAPVALAEAWFAPRPSVALFAGAGGQVQLAPDRSFTSVAPRAAARFALRHGLSLAVLVEVPVAGRDRTDLVAGLFAGWTPP